MKVKEFKGYLFYEDGSVFNSKGRKLSIRRRFNRFEIRLSYEGVINYYMYHRIRYFLFVGGFDLEDKNTCVIAKDGDYTNLDLSNYELRPRQVIISRENHKRTKLTMEQVEELKREYKGKCGVNQHSMTDYRSYSFFAEKYGVSKSTIAWLIRDYKIK